MIKNRKDAGADERTPSIPQYFSWINSTNEGSTEEQTLINLDFFRYMKEEYGMQIGIYAWDAGNFDGASQGYGDLKSEKFISQYPEGYKNVVKKASELGIRMGLWGSPDGYGDDEKTERERYEFYVHLCRDYGFGLFKLDGVCGQLRPEKAAKFAEMLRECREYVPELIVLNHRLNLYEAEKHVTTFLWNGNETYVDVLIKNHCTAMHNRAYTFTRGHVENLQRLAEDHGVCISSSIDYFEDELIYQAFNRSLILAPEIYGNPWFMRDDELPKLARIYNLHRRNAPILVDGMLLGNEYGCEACSRGSGEKRFISTGNNEWNAKKITVSLDESIGLDCGGSISVNIHHPYEKHLGIYNFGDKVEIELMPFRAVLIEASAVEKSEIMLTDCEYEIIKESADGEPLKVKILTADKGDIYLLKGKEKTFFMSTENVDIKEKAPVFLGSLNEMSRDKTDREFLYETANFAVNNDALEVRSIKRSGETEIPEVRRCRDAFFNQETYKLRGCENANMFDGNPDTFYDSQSKTYVGGLRIKGGCLRVDAGCVVDADNVEIEFFDIKEATNEVKNQTVPTRAEYSEDLRKWNASEIASVNVTDSPYVQKVVEFKVHTVYDAVGSRAVASYPVNGKVRYLRMACPPDRIYAVRFIKDGKEIKLVNPKANNLQPHFRENKPYAIKNGKIVLPDYREGSRLAVAIEGFHGVEGAYCAVEIDGVVEGCPMRAPDFVANQWEHCVCNDDSYYTYFYPLRQGLSGKEIKVSVLFCNKGAEGKEPDCNVYLCDKH